ncbi:MAG: HAMP domain-containing sensor histidine kinase [Kibdelosporangium sp.]
MRRRVLILVAATASLVLIAFLVPLASLVRSVAADRALQQATAEAQTLSSLVTTTDRQALTLAVQQVDATSPYDVTVFLPDGTRLGAQAARSSLVELAAHGRSASSEVTGGREIVFAVNSLAGAAGVIRTFVPAVELTKGVGRAWLLLALLGVALLAVSLLVADRMARTLVRSTIKLEGVSQRLAHGDLAARADPDSPGELGAVAVALNRLATRITDLLREERETVADLSHRLRTPLTALRLEAEALDAPKVTAGVDAVQLAISQVIEQARRKGTDTAPNSDAAEVVRERVAFWQVLAEDTDRAVSTGIAAGRLPVAVPRPDLEACVDALLSNVFAHTPDGTGFAVHLTARSGGGATLVISDEGPGMPAAKHAKAMQRGASGAGSTGLGLDIVRRTAEQAGGTVTLSGSPSGQGGLTVTVRLGPPA